jgi:hypothetical protein
MPQSEPTIIECACGVRYERSERQLPIKDIGCFDCVECNARLEIWSGRKVPLFKRIVESITARKSA